MVVLICLLLVVPCQAEVIVCFPMDSDPDWTTEGQWEFGVPQGGGGPQSYDPTSGYTGANVYGYNLAGNYENDIAEYRLTTSALNCALAENVTLSFWRWLGVESSLYDHAKIQVSNDGTNWTGVWVNGAGNLADISWVYCEYDISAVADRQPTVFVRWCMGPTDFSAAYAGWNIDDVCLDGDLLDALFISPNDVFFSLGPEGGPFEPACKSYTLTNEGASVLNWTAEGTQSWLDVSPGGGTLSPGAFVPVEICINSTANTLDEGRYTDAVSFTNTNSGFSHLIDITLYVGDEKIVPFQFPTIQSAIDNVSDGDTIVVMDGTYEEELIDFKGKAITLKSATGPESCVLTYPQGSTIVHFHSGEDSQSVLEGFTVDSYCDPGRGIYCENSSPKIVNCIITSSEWGWHEISGAGMYNKNSNPILIDCSFIDNRAIIGGGMYNTESNPILINCIFKGNSSVDEHGYGRGGGMYNVYSNPTLFNCIFTRNHACGGCTGVYGGYGGGMYNRFSKPVLINCTFFRNSVCSEGKGGGMYNYEGKPTLTNCIFWGNSDDGGVDESAQVHTVGVGGPVINYSCIQGWTGGFGGSGNTGADPCFADSSSDDYHLKSWAGRWDADSESWVRDDWTSRCIDAGDPNSDWTEELWPHGKRINMGAYGGTSEASMSALDLGNVADLSNDDSVNYTDMMLFTDKWLFEEVLLAEDLNRDGFVDFTDFAIFADNWLWKQ